MPSFVAIPTATPAWVKGMLWLAVVGVAAAYLTDVALAVLTYTGRVASQDVVARLLRSTEAIATGVAASFVVWIGVKTTSLDRDDPASAAKTIAAFVYFSLSVLVLLFYLCYRPSGTPTDAVKGPIEALAKTTWGMLITLYLFVVRGPIVALARAVARQG